LGEWFEFLPHGEAQISGTEDIPRLMQAQTIPNSQKRPIFSRGFWVFLENDLFFCTFTKNRTMPFDAKIFRVLVASPGDVGEERNIIPEIINEWNAINSHQSKVSLMPVKWETHSSPLLGNRPQGIINEQIVKECDLLVGVFWTRIGTNTGAAISGTAEEIEQFVKMKKPVMLYFSQNPIAPDKIDLGQFSVLKKFKEKMRMEGLTETYYTIDDFRQKFGRQLSLNISNLINNTIEGTEKPKNKRAGVGSTRGEKTNDTQSTIKPAKISPVNLDEEKLTEAQVDDYLVSAVKKVSNDSGWARMAALGSYLQTYTPVDYRDLGFPKLIAFLKSRELFEFKEVKGHPTIKVKMES
jgi:hypothetical protein